MRPVIKFNTSIIKNNAVPIIFSIAIFLFLLILSEVSCRIYIGDKFLRNSEILFVADQFGRSIGNKKDYSGYAFGADVYTDKNGFRIPRNYRPEEQHFRSAILILGDSISFGYWEKEEDSTAGLIRKAFPSIEVYNSSVVGYAARDYKNVADYFIPKHNEIKHVYLFFCLNDVVPVSSALINETVKIRNVPLERLRTIKSTGIIEPIHYYLYNHSKLYLLIRALVTNIPWRDWNEINYLYRKENVGYFYKEMRPIIDIAATLNSKGIKFTVVILPFEIQLINNERYPQEQIKTLLRKNGIEFIDVYEIFKSSKIDPGKLYLKFDAMHLSSTGHRLIFDRLKNTEFRMR